jgi:hypothetical protein
MTNSNITIIKQTVTAKSRKLKAEWTIESHEIADIKYYTIDDPIVIDGVKWYAVQSWYDVIYDWITSRSPNLWTEEDEGYLIHENLYTLFLLEFGQ